MEAAERPGAVMVTSVGRSLVRARGTNNPFTEAQRRSCRRHLGQQALQGRRPPAPGIVYKRKYERSDQKHHVKTRIDMTSRCVYNSEGAALERKSVVMLGLKDPWAGETVNGDSPSSSIPE